LSGALGGQLARFRSDRRLTGGSGLSFGSCLSDAESTRKCLSGRGRGVTDSGADLRSFDRDPGSALFSFVFNVTLVTVEPTTFTAGRRAGGQFGGSQLATRRGGRRLGRRRRARFRLGDLAGADKTPDE